MKTLVAAATVVATLATTGYSQSVNWRALDDQRTDVVQVNIGYDYAATAQVGYARLFDAFRPVLVGVDLSLPMGKDLVDDFKIRLGGQIEIVEAGGFSATIRLASLFRRYESDFVRIVSFGSDFGLLAGYYDAGWFAAGEFGFDKSIISNLKHAGVLKEYFPGIRDGWYIPTGGHYYYGIQAGKTLGELLDLSLRLGATTAQASDENAVLPYYLQLGVGVRF